MKPASSGAPGLEEDLSRHLLDEVGRGGARFERVVLTRNRRVMVSVGERGRVLRLHEGFREAPSDVLRAIGRLLSPGGRGLHRSAARDAVREYVARLPSRPTVARRRRPSAADHPFVERLQAEFDRVNAEHFDGELPRVPIYLSGRMRTRNGHFSVHPLEIVVSRRLCEHAEDGEAASTLRHEMIHLWQHHSGRRPDHGREFRQWARRLDVHPRATRKVGWKAAR